MHTATTMGVPLRAVTVAALAGCGLLIVVYRVRSPAYLVRVFAMAWSAQLLAWLLWTTLVYPHFTSPLRHLPTPPGAHWLFGHGPKILAANPGGITTVPHQGLIRYFFFFNRERVVVTSPKALAEVLVTKNYLFPKPDAVRTSLGRVLGYGILLAEGDEHKIQRKNLLPAFHFRHVKGLYPTFWRKARELLDAMEETVRAGGDEGAVLEVNSWASRCTLDIIGVAGMGVDFGAIQDENNPLASTYINLSTPNRQAKILMIMGMVLPGWLISHLPLKRNDEINAAAQRIRGVCRDLIVKKRKRLAGKEPLDPDIISVALESGLFTDEQLVDQLMTFLAAGHDTTASALTWALYLMTRHPEMQKRLRDEVRGALPSPGTDADLSSADIDRLPFLNAFCSEVLRVFSPVPQTIREAACDTTIQGQFIPRGTRIMLSPWGTNVAPGLWGDDAAEFKPERWLSSSAAAAASAGGGGGGEGGGGTGDGSGVSIGSGGAESNYAFMTFLHGPRSCIGAAFARGELACLLAACVGRFEYELADEAMADERNIKLKAAVTARPAYGMPLRTRVVEGW
ncbi:cytochrome P450 97B3 [Purpureocillium lavendulum]|uniref:Cytochrome P450 97B3 n=1 Tax=Purpureocillium lavendulum TaxID=1247861 RepID=A0AB34G3M7_9HYPO|nr:cytochrome P450 97B3 [Purpureocillium lavendulum]